MFNNNQSIGYVSAKRARVSPRMCDDQTLKLSLNTSAVHFSVLKNRNIVWHSVTPAFHGKLYKWQNLHEIFTKNVKNVALHISQGKPGSLGRVNNYVYMLACLVQSRASLPSHVCTLRSYIAGKIETIMYSLLYENRWAAESVSTSICINCMR